MGLAETVWGENTVGKEKVEERPWPRLMARALAVLGEDEPHRGRVWWQLHKGSLKKKMFQ